MLARRRLFLIAAVVLTVLSVPLTYKGAVQRNKSANFEEWSKEVDKSIPPESPGLPLIVVYEPALVAGTWCCGSFFLLSGLLLAWLLRHSLVALRLRDRVIFFLLIFGGPAALCIWETVDAAYWGFWLLALRALASATAVGLGAYVVFTTPLNVRLHDESRR